MRYLPSKVLGKCLDLLSTPERYCKVQFDRDWGNVNARDAKGQPCSPSRHWGLGRNAVEWTLCGAVTASTGDNHFDGFERVDETMEMIEQTIDLMGLGPCSCRSSFRRAMDRVGIWENAGRSYETIIDVITKTRNRALEERR